MPKALVVTEKPSVARDIASALRGFEDEKEFFENDMFVVTWAVGHLLEFLEPEAIDPKYKRWMLEDLPIIPSPFSLQPKSGQSERLKVLKKLYKRDDVTTIINACDAGREGELIFREIVDYLHSFKNSPSPKPMKRLWLQSMTSEAIRDGFSSLRPGEEFDGLGYAAQCRSEADWLIGINATRALTRRMKTRTEKTAWSAGRVQTPTLALLVDRELESLAHRPEPFWRIKANFRAGGHSYEGTWYDPDFVPDPDLPRKDDWITEQAVLDRILAEITGKPGHAQETRKLHKESARPLFDLTSLQREANRRFGFSARQTLQAAQRLYETHKALTYPRTDSKCLPNDYKNHVREVIDGFASGTEFGGAARYLQQKGLQNQSKVFDDSQVSDHFAIIPTKGRVPAGLSGADAKIYDLVTRRFLAAFYPPAEWTRVERTTVIEGHHFRSRARFLTTPGWYEVWGKEEGEGKYLPPLQALDKAAKELAEGLAGKAVAPSQARPGWAAVRCDKADSESDETRPPARYSEARLLSLMEHAGKQVEDEEITEVLKGKGLGTPATRADIIENLVSKQYARRAEKTLRATPKGILLIDLLRRIKAERLASPRLTGELELHLAEVESGQRSRDDFMAEVVEYTEEIVRLAKTFQYDELYLKDPPLGDCPIAKHLKVVERSRFYCSEDNTGKNGQGVGFIIWKEKNGRYIDRTTMVELLTQGETPLLEGFLTSRGQGYKGKLRLDKEGNLELISEDGKVAGGPVAVVEIPDDATPLVDCPFNSACNIYQTEVAYQCRCDETCKATHKKLKSVAILPRVVCHREISPEEAVQFFAEGKTDEWDNFISRYGRPFKAKLFLKDNGKHGFEFAPRAPKKKKEKAPDSDQGTKTKAKSKKGKSTANSKTKSKAKTKAKAKTRAKTKAKAKAKKE
ncbi:MAG: DNA topoisomerase 3 [Vulcanimicrobiota bacterium]